MDPFETATRLARKYTPQDVIRCHVLPAERWGWLAVAEVPVQFSRYWLPPKHTRWRPTKALALKAIPKAQAAVRRDIDRRDRGVDRRSEREFQKVEL